jgi:thiol-disulfide isomerase/thioredoxin
MSRWWVYGLTAMIMTLSGVYLSLKMNERQVVPAQAQALAGLLATSITWPSGAKPQSIAELPAKHVLVNFWATWCTPCREEIPDLMALQTELGNKELQIIGYSLDRLEPVRRFIAEVKLNYPNVEGDMAGIEMIRALGSPAGGLPFSILLNSEGQVIGALTGKVDINRVKAVVKAVGK